MLLILKFLFVIYYNYFFIFTDSFIKHNIIVTLTSWKMRIKFIAKNIEIILNNTIKPKKVILNLSVEEFPKKTSELPKNLLYLLSKYDNFEIFWVQQNNIFFVVLNFLIILINYNMILFNNHDSWIKPYNNIVKIFSNKLKWKKEKIDLQQIKKEIEIYDNDKFQFINEVKFKYKESIISIILTIYNQALFIKKIYSCIIKQSLKDIEIIIINDNSNDNSENIIKELMLNDQRIIYLRNNINRGQFYSRNIGALKSKGEYILVIDPDDLLLNEILLKSYITAKYYNLDILQYYHMIGSYKENQLKSINISGIYYSNQANEMFFNISTRYLWDKLIKRNK